MLRLVNIGRHLHRFRSKNLWRQVSVAKRLASFATEVCEYGIRFAPVEWPRADR